MKLCEWVWLNGDFVKKNIPLPWLTPSIFFCPGMQYGAGVFEGIRFYKTHDGHKAIFRLQEHLERFYYSASEIFMRIPYTKEEMIHAMKYAVILSGIDDGYIRPWAGFTEEKVGLDITDSKVSCVIGVLDWPAYYSGPQKISISPMIRPHPSSFPTNAKICGTYVNSIRSHMQAKNAGFTEALLADYQDNVGEASAANIFLYFQQFNQLFTPQTESILPGITRDTVFKICKKVGIPDFFETDLRVANLCGADEIFLCGTAAEIAPVTFIDYENVRPRLAIRQKEVGDGQPGPITKKLQKLYGQIVRGEIPEYKHWLTYVD